MILVIMGGTNSGKNYFSKKCEKYGFERVITNTTRPRRKDDKENAYHFLTKEEFMGKLEKGLMLEYTKYNDNYYGVSIDSLSKNCVVILDPNGYRVLKEKLGSQVYGIFLDIPEEVRFNRGLARGDDISTLVKRLEEDKLLFTDAFKKSVSFVVSEKMEQDADELLKSNIVLFYTD